MTEPSSRLWRLQVHRAGRGWSLKSERGLVYINPNGGAIALCNPLGMSGPARITALRRSSFAGAGS
ncbi:hypothetical protein NKJ61_09655 [Mesorhizobium sp. M0091]